MTRALDVSTFCDTNTAKQILAVLQRHAADLLRAECDDQPSLKLAAHLDAGIAGGNAVETLNQNSPEFPEDLDHLWRVLCAFELYALGGYLTTNGVETTTTETSQVPPWMLHTSGGIIRSRADKGDTQAAGLLNVAHEFLGVELPSYTQLAAADR